MKGHLNKCSMWVVAAVLMLIISVPSAMAMEEEIVGTVINTGVGYAIIANSGEYIVQNEDLSKYVGDTVVVNGNVEVGADSLALDPIDTMQVLSNRNLIDPAVAPPHVSG